MFLKLPLVCVFYTSDVLIQISCTKIFGAAQLHELVWSNESNDHVCSAVFDQAADVYMFKDTLEPKHRADLSHLPTYKELELCW